MAVLETRARLPSSEIPPFPIFSGNDQPTSSSLRKVISDTTAEQSSIHRQKIVISGFRFQSLYLLNNIIIEQVTKAAAIVEDPWINV